MQSTSLKLARKFLGEEIEVTMDRPLGSVHPKHGFVYEANYGFVEGVQAPDGENLDAYYLGVSESLQKAKGVCIAIIHRLKDDDDKLIVVPNDTELTDAEIASQTHFQERWFESEIIRE